MCLWAWRGIALASTALHGTASIPGTRFWVGDGGSLGVLSIDECVARFPDCLETAADAMNALGGTLSALAQGSVALPPKCTFGLAIAPSTSKTEASSSHATHSAAAQAATARPSTDAPDRDAPIRSACDDFRDGPSWITDGQYSIPPSVKPPRVETGPEIAVRFYAWSKRRQPEASSASGPVGFGDFFGVVEIDAVRFKKVILHSPNTDPYQCCAAAVDGEILFQCWFSGADVYVGRGVISVSEGELSVRWCTEQQDELLDRGNRSFRVAPHSRLRLVSPKTVCYPPSPM